MATVVYGSAQPAVVVMQPATTVVILNPTHTWKTELNSACCEDPATCCTALFCPHCFVYHQRKRLLAVGDAGRTSANGAEMM